MNDAAAYFPAVKKMARVMVQRLSSNIEFDDLVQAGMLGVIEAMNRFDATRGATRLTFVQQRAKGAMLDFLREADPLSRGVRRRIREATAAARRLESKFGHPPRESDIAAAVGMRLDEYQMLLLLALHEEKPIDDETFLNLSSESPTPEQLYEQAQFDAELERQINRLSPRHKRALIGFYIEGRDQITLGIELGVTGARVSQLNKQSLEILRRRLS